MVNRLTFGSWLVGWAVGWLVGCLVVWLVGWSLAGDYRVGERRLRPAGAGIVAVSPAGRLRCAPRGRGARQNSLRAARYAQTAVASQFTKRAARAAPTPAVLAAPQRQPRRDAATARWPQHGAWDKCRFSSFVWVLASTGHRGRVDARGRPRRREPGLTRTSGPFAGVLVVNDDARRRSRRADRMLQASRHRTRASAPSSVTKRSAGTPM